MRHPQRVFFLLYFWSELYWDSHTLGLSISDCQFVITHSNSSRVWRTVSVSVFRPLTFLFTYAVILCPRMVFFCNIVSCLSRVCPDIRSKSLPLSLFLPLTFSYLFLTFFFLPFLTSLSLPSSVSPSVSLSVCLSVSLSLSLSLSLSVTPCPNVTREKVWRGVVENGGKVKWWG